MENGMNETRNPGTENQDQRAQRLYEQAELIRRAAGIDVMSAFEQDPQVQARVRSGEWDFADLAASMRATGHVPATAHSANGVSVAGRDVRSMSQTEFERLNEQLDRGFSVRL